MHLLRLSLCVSIFAVGLFSRDSRADDRIIDTIAGTGKTENNGSRGDATEINIGQPFGVEIGPRGDLFITEVANHRVWRLDRQTNMVTVVAGSGRLGYSGDGGPAIEADMNEPYEIRFDESGHLFVVEMQNHIVRRIDADTGIITTIAGTGEPGYSGDGGPATKAQLRVPHGIALDGNGNLYIADIGNHRVRRVRLETGIIDTLVGTGENARPVDGTSVKGSPIPGPRALAANRKSLWVVLREGHAVWRIDLGDETMHHLAGTGKPGFTGDGGPARAATFNGPKGLALDELGNLYVVDSENDAIRKIDAKSGIVTTLAGVGKRRAYSGDGGPAAMAELSQPHGICVDSKGTVIIGDTLNHRVRAIMIAK